MAPNLSAFDFFGREPAFKIKGRSKYSTSCGVWMTILALLIILALLGTNIKTLLDHSAPRSINEEESMSPRPFTDDFTKVDMVLPMIFFQKRHYLTKVMTNINKTQLLQLAEPVYFYNNSIKADEGEAERKYWVTYFNLTTCDDQRMKLWKNYKLYDPEIIVYCFNQTSGDIPTNPPSKIRRMRNQFEIRITLCNRNYWNKTLRNPNCVNNQTWMHFTYVGLIMFGVDYTLNDYYSPVKPVITSVSLTKIKKSRWQMHHFHRLTKVVVKTKSGPLNLLGLDDVRSFSAHKISPVDYPVYTNILAPGGVFLTSYLRLRLEAGHECIEIVRNYIGVVYILSKLGGLSKSVIAALGFFYLFCFNRFDMKKYVIEEMLDLKDENIPSYLKVLQKQRKLANRVSKKGIYKTLSEQEKKELCLYEILDRWYEDRVDIVKNLQKATVNRLLVKAFLSAEQIKLLRLVYINKCIQMRKRGESLGNLTVEEAVAAFREFEPQNEHEERVMGYLNKHLPKEILEMDVNTDKFVFLNNKRGSVFSHAGSLFLGRDTQTSDDHLLL